MRINISDMMDYARDDTVSLRETEDIDSAHITALTMAKLHGDGARSGGGNGKRLSRGAAIVLAAAVCLALSVTAAAVGIARSVNWQGEPVAGETPPLPTETPAEEAWSAETAKAERIYEVLSRRGERECVIVRSKDGASGNARSAPVASLEALRELLEREDSPLTVPFLAAPAGYTLRDGWAAYDSAAGYGYTLASTETTEDGLTVEHYTAPEEGDFISAYCLAYQNADGEQLTFSAQMEVNGESGFGVGEGGTVEALALEGMDDALVIENADGNNEIFMRMVFAAPVAYENMFALMDASGTPWEPWEYTEASYCVSGSLSAAELRELLYLDE